jgi:hypothetical protein
VVPDPEHARAQERLALARLLELLEHERAAVEGRRFEALAEIKAAELALLRSLQGRLDPGDLPALERALARSRETETALVAGLAETQGVIERLRTGRRAVSGYAQGPRARGALEIRA